VLIGPRREGSILKCQEIARELSQNQERFSKEDIGENYERVYEKS